MHEQYYHLNTLKNLLLIFNYNSTPHKCKQIRLIFVLPFLHLILDKATAALACTTYSSNNFGNHNVQQYRIKIFCLFSYNCFLFFSLLNVFFLYCFIAYLFILFKYQTRKKKKKTKRKTQECCTGPL